MFPIIGEVVIRTNSFETKLTINAPLDTVAHYSYVSRVDIQSIKGTSYDEYGTAGRIEVKEGHVEAMPGCEIFCLMEAPAEGKTVNSSTINQGAIVHTNDVNIKGDVDVTKDEEGRANGHVDDCGPGRHSFSQLVIDSEHVYDVCTCCGYTLIAGNGVKTTATGDDGEPVVSHIADVSELKNEGSAESLTCQHSWTHTHEGEQCITKCTKCGIEIAQEHTYFNSETSRLYANCPLCDAKFGTEEIPWHIENELAFVAMDYVTYRTSNHFKIVNDLDLTDYTKLTNKRSASYALYYFVGTLDGCGHNILLSNKFLIYSNVNKGDFTLKNITFTITTKNDNPVLFRWLNMDGDYCNATFENISVKGLEEGAIYTGGGSIFEGSAITGGKTSFINVDYNLNYNLSASYAGLYINNYAYQTSGAPQCVCVFEDCDINGNITGTNVGIFLGNNNGKTFEILSSKYSLPSGTKTGLYISNCKNNGSITANTTYGPIGIYSSSSHTNTINAKIIESGLFEQGNVSIGGVKVGLEKDGKELKIGQGSDKAKSYKITYFAGTGWKKDGESLGSGYAIISFNFDATETTKTSKLIKKIVLSNDTTYIYESIDSIEYAEDFFKLKYKLVEESDGFVAVISNDYQKSFVESLFGEGATISGIGGVSVRLDAFDANGIVVGSKVYSVTDFN